MLAPSNAAWLLPAGSDSCLCTAATALAERLPYLFCCECQGDIAVVFKTTGKIPIGIASMNPRCRSQSGLQDGAGLGKDAEAFQAALQGTCRAWSLWASMLRWIHFAASVVDAGKPSEFFECSAPSAAGSSLSDLC